MNSNKNKTLKRLGLSSMIPRASTKILLNKKGVTKKNNSAVTFMQNKTITQKTLIKFSSPFP
jgi:hypothetical protein